MNKARVPGLEGVAFLCFGLGGVKGGEWFPPSTFHLLDARIQYWMLLRNKCSILLDHQFTRARELHIRELIANKGEKMHLFENTETCELIDLEDAAEFKKYIDGAPSGLMFVPEKYGECKDLVVKSGAGSFAKWVKQKHPEIHIDSPNDCKKLVLNNNDYWMPLAYLATDITLPVYLSIVASYIYDCMKSSLRGENARVHIEVVYQDEKNGVTKSFKYTGGHEGLRQAMKKIDVNKLME